MSQLDDCPANGLRLWLSCLIEQPIRVTFLSAAQNMTDVFTRQSSNSDSKAGQTAEARMASMHKAAARILMGYERSPRMHSPVVASPSPPSPHSTTLPAPKRALLSTTAPGAAAPIEEAQTKTEASVPTSSTKPLPAIEIYKRRLQDARSSGKRTLEDGGEVQSSVTKRLKCAELQKDNDPPPSNTRAPGPSTLSNTSPALSSATNANVATTNVASSAATLRKVCSLNLSGKGPWSATASVPCHGNPCVAKLHICKKYWGGVKESGDSNACEHGGDDVQHRDSASQVTWVHVRPTCMFEMRDSKRQCAGSCVWAHRRDGSAEEWKVRMARAEE
ncbi:hypothetical protein PRZ48_011477 [Zasmidium cellare]|uniref:C3H1-type domain-containing protein n=1 Tax=Zasmidium cellare TaxID=395010 RepID=A0ABR0E6G5_ZASCE|nr:hypothetical protein PRZ48_011477 [Zasmidium cellare]